MVDVERFYQALDENEMGTISFVWQILLPKNDQTGKIVLFTTWPSLHNAKKLAELLKVLLLKVESSCYYKYDLVTGEPQLNCFLF